TRDVWMLELREDLPLATEAANQIVFAERRCDNLDRDLFGELVVCARGEIHGAHTATADLAHDAIRSEPATCPADRPKGDLTGRAFEKGVARAIVCLEQGLYSGARLQVGASGVEKRRALVVPQLESALEKAPIQHTVSAVVSERCRGRRGGVVYCASIPTNVRETVRVRDRTLHPAHACKVG